MEEGQKLVWHDNRGNRKVFVIYREPYGENNSLVYLYSKTWKAMGDRLVINCDLEIIKSKEEFLDEFKLDKLDFELCIYCVHGEYKPFTQFSDGCMGERCNEAYENYLEELLVI